MRWSATGNSHEPLHHHRLAGVVLKKKAKCCVRSCWSFATDQVHQDPLVGFWMESLFFNSLALFGSTQAGSRIRTNSFGAIHPAPSDGRAEEGAQRHQRYRDRACHGAPGPSSSDQANLSSAVFTRNPTQPRTAIDEWHIWAPGRHGFPGHYLPSSLENWPPKKPRNRSCSEPWKMLRWVSQTPWRREEGCTFRPYEWMRSNSCPQGQSRSRDALFCSFMSLACSRTSKLFCLCLLRDARRPS